MKGRIRLIFQFQTQHQYMFIHNRTKHLLLIWEQEQTTEIYLVEEQEENPILHYPGQTYQQEILQLLDPVFFLNVDTGSETLTTVLGATFPYQNKLIGYYVPQDPEKDWDLVYFFDITNGKVRNIPDREFDTVVNTFRREFPDSTIS